MEPLWIVTDDCCECDGSGVATYYDEDEDCEYDVCCPECGGSGLEQ